MDDVVVDAVLDVRAAIGDAEDALGVGLVLGEQQRHVPFAVEVAFAQFGIDGLDDSVRRSPSKPARRPGLSDRRARTTGCGTRASAGRAARPASGPRLWTLIWIRMSSGDSLAYSTKTSK